MPGTHSRADHAKAAAPAFVGRTQEALRFRQKLDEYLRDTIDGGNTNAGDARSNLLVITGVSGVGKSGLASALRAWVVGDDGPPLEWGALGYADRARATLALEANGAELTQPEFPLFRLRAQLGAAGVRCNAFDLGLALWWEEFHPGFAPPQIATRSGYDFAGQLGSTLDDLVGWRNELAAVPQLALGSLGVGLVTFAYKAIRQRTLHRGTLNACEPLRGLVDDLDREAPSATALDLGDLLAWDLQQLDAHDRPLVVGFVDTTEEAIGKDRSRERALNSLVGRTPFVYWVLSGQEPVAWEEDPYAGVFEFAGPLVWSNAAGDGSAIPHIRLSPLDDADALELARGWFALPRMPPVDDDALAALVSAAAGFPTHLRLAAVNARNADERGVFDPSQLEATYPQLVSKAIENLPVDHATLLRHATLVAFFDGELLHRATGITEGTCMDFCRRGVVEPPSAGPLPFRIHDTLRAWLAEEPRSVPGAWTQADRRTGAARMLDALESRTRETEKTDSGARVPLLREAGKLCAAHGIEADWIRVQAGEMHAFRALVGVFPSDASAGWISEVARFYDCWAVPGSAQRIPKLQQVAATAHDSRVRDMAKRFAAYALKTGGRVGEAIPLFEELLDSPEATANLRLQYLLALIQAERFTTLAGEIDAYESALKTTGPSRPRRALAFALGRLEDSHPDLSNARQKLESDFTSRSAMNTLTTNLRAQCLAGGLDAGVAEVWRARSEELRRDLSQRSAILACILLSDTESRARALIDEAAAVIERSNGFYGFREQIEACVVGARWSDPELIALAHLRAVEGGHAPSPDYRLADRFFVALGYGSLYEPAEYGPYGEHAEVEDRWRPIVESWLALRA